MWGSEIENCRWTVVQSYTQTIQERDIPTATAQEIQNAGVPCFAWWSETLGSREDCRTGKGQVLLAKNDSDCGEVHWQLWEVYNVEEPLSLSCSITPNDLQWSCGACMYWLFLTLEPDSSGFANILVVTDHFSRYAQAYPMKDQRAATVAKVLVERFFIHYGLPARIHSDQGRDF